MTYLAIVTCCSVIFNLLSAFVINHVGKLTVMDWIIQEHCNVSRLYFFRIIAVIMETHLRSNLVERIVLVACRLWVRTVIAIIRIISFQLILAWTEMRRWQLLWWRLAWSHCRLLSVSSPAFLLWTSCFDFRRENDQMPWFIHRIDAFDESALSRRVSTVQVPNLNIQNANESMGFSEGAQTVLAF